MSSLRETKKSKNPIEREKKSKNPVFSVEGKEEISVIKFTVNNSWWQRNVIFKRERKFN